MPLRARARATAAGMALALGSACASPLQVQEHPTLAERRIAHERVAVVPFRAGAAGAEEAPGGGESVGALVAGYVFEALAERGVDTLAPSEVASLLGLEQAPAGALDAKAVAARLHESFGATAVLLGAVVRFRDRSGSAVGATHPASVYFEVTLHAAPEGTRLWTASFDETQQGLSANVLNLGRYPGGGTRWLRAEELARWGAREVAAALPVTPSAAGTGR